MSDQSNLNAMKLDLIARIIQVDDLELLKKISELLNNELNEVE